MRKKGANFPKYGLSLLSISSGVRSVRKKKRVFLIGFRNLFLHSYYLVYEFMNFVHYLLCILDPM